MSLISEALTRWLPMHGRVRNNPTLGGRLAARESPGANEDQSPGAIKSLALPLSSRPTRSGEPGPSLTDAEESCGSRVSHVGSPGMTSCKGTATGPLIAYQNLGEPVWAPRDYAAFAREGFMQNAIVYRSVRMIAEAAASIPLLLYEGANEIEDHPLIDLLRRPSLDHTGTDFLEAWYGFLLVAGNAYVEAVALDGEMRELHILRPDRMKVIPGLDGWPEGYEYTVAGRSVRFVDEVAAGVRPILHVRLFHPANDHYGMSPIEAAATAIDIHNTASSWNKALLDNSARPSGALVYAAANGQMTDEQFTRLKSELETNFQGARAAGRPLLLEGGLDWKPLSLSPKDMDFIEAKNSAAREIALAIGVPPMLLGIPGDNTYSNYQEAQRAFWRQTVLPLVNRTARALSSWLAPAFATSGALGGRRESFFALDDSAPRSRPPSALEIKPDLDQIEALAPERDALWKRLEAASFLTDDEKRAAAGYGAKPDADGTKYNPYHDELGLFTTPDRAVAPGSGSTDGRVRVAQADSRRSGYPIDILEEDAIGGHTYGEHIGKSEEYLKARITGSRRGVPYIFGVGEKRAGSFSSLEAANKLVNSTIADPENAAKIEMFREAKYPFWLPELRIFKSFASPTGIEAYSPDDRTLPTMRPTSGVTVRLIRTDRVPRGYYVDSAWPMNED